MADVVKDVNLIKGEDAVLLIHGLSGSPLEMQYVGRMLHKAGFSVRIPRFTRHGYGSAPSSEKWQDWHAEVVGHFDDMKRKYRSVSVCGLCLGAVLALNLAAERQNEIAGLSLLSTTLDFDGWAVPWYRFLLKIGYYTPFRYIYAYQEHDPFGIKNEQLRAWISREMGEKSTFAALSARIPMTRLHQMEKLIGAVKRKLSRISAPALIIHSIEDDTTSIKSANYVEKHIGSLRMRKVFLDDCYHNVTLDNQKQLVVDETVRFFREAIAADPRIQDADLNACVA